MTLGGEGGALLTPFDDNNELTVAMVVRRPSVDTVLAGAITGTAADGGEVCLGRRPA